MSEIDNKFEELYDQLEDVIPLPISKAYKPYLQELCQAYHRQALKEVLMEWEREKLLGIPNYKTMIDDTINNEGYKNPTLKEEIEYLRELCQFQSSPQRVSSRGVMMLIHAYENLIDDLRSKIANDGMTRGEIFDYLDELKKRENL